MKDLRIELMTEASPTVAERLISRAIKNLVAPDSSGSPFRWEEPVTLVEGTEKCGYGQLHISGRASCLTAFGRVNYRINSSGSQWKNYGFPSGTKYEISIRLEREKASAEMSAL